MTDFAKLILEADTKGLKTGERDLRSLGRAAGTAANDVDSSSRRMIDGFKRVGGAFAAAFAISGSLSAVIRTNADFGASMSKVAAISGATGAELDKLRETAKAMGAQTMFSASQAADALGFLAMAGFSASEAMESIPSVLALAQAGGLGLAEAADIASNVLSGFGLKARDAAMAADVLAVAASSTNTSVSQLGQAMSTAAPIAAALGISIQDTAAAIGVMSDAGIQGERAGTALRGIFASLAGPTKQATDALAKYGITANQINPEKVGLIKAFEVLAKANISTADAMAIFGREAASGALVMAGTTGRMNELSEAFSNAEGAAKDMADIMSDNLNGDILSLQSAFEGLTIAIGDGGASGSLRGFVQTATEAVRALTANLGILVNALMTVAGGWAAYRIALLAGSAATTVMSSTLAFNASVVMATARSLGVAAAAQVALSGATTAATGAFARLTAAMAANPFGAVAVAVGVLTAAFIGLRNAQAEARAETDNLIRSLDAAIKARGADVASKRAEADVERMRGEDRLKQIRAEQSRTAVRDPFTGKALPLSQQGGRYKALESEATDLTWTIVQLEGTVRLADRTLKDMEKTAGDVAVPIAQGAGAAKELSGSLDKASTSAKKAADDFQRLYDRLNPFEASLRQLEADKQLVLSQKNLTQARKEELIAALEQERFRNRTRGLGPAAVSRGLLNEGPLNAGLPDLTGYTAEQLRAQARAEEVLRTTGDVAASIKILQQASAKASNAIGESFAQMADRTLQALDRMTSAIRGGGFLDILSTVVNLGIQLGGMGVFGKGVQANILAGARANGGQVNAGRTYLVGERGPELFSPATNGQIVSNDNMRGGGMVINVDARGSSDPEAVRQQVERGILEAAPAIVAAAQQRTITTLRRPKLAGAL